VKRKDLFWLTVLEVQSMISWPYSVMSVMRRHSQEKGHSPHDQGAKEKEKEGEEEEEGRILPSVT
jgi:hypothetical protein